MMNWCGHDVECLDICIVGASVGVYMGVGVDVDIGVGVLVEIGVDIGVDMNHR